MHIQATLRECAGWFNCSIDTIEAAVKRTHGVDFAEYKEQKSGKGKISIRRKQFEVAMNGNIAMLIWLGKNWLGQTDTIDRPNDEPLNNVFELNYKV